MSEEKMRESFEADAAAYGFDMTRQESAAPEPWSEYLEMETGMRWGGFIAGYKAALNEQNALLTVQVPEGWRLVPVEPTKEMWKAGAKRAEIELSQAALCWCDMLAAAPAHHQSEDARDAAIAAQEKTK